MKKTLLLLFSVFLLLPFSSKAQDTPATVWDIITESPDHTLFETIVIAGQLTGTLTGDGPLTVFAPTDAAIGALPSEVTAALLANPSVLTDIVTYHVVGGAVMAGDLSDGQSVATLQGANVSFTISDAGAMINGANISVVDLVASNGVVHVIDAVLMPPPAMVNVSFAVDMAAYPNEFTQVYVSGSLNGWAGEDNPLSDADGDGIWTGTIPLEAGTYEYKFTLDNWAVQEEFTAGAGCTLTTGEFTNRLIEVTADASICFNWNSCTLCGEATDYVPMGATPVSDVNFSVDMNGYDAAFTQVYVSGSLNGWSGDANPLSDEDGDGVWTGSIPLEHGAYEYKFTLDNWTAQEEFAEGEECTLTTDGFTNRLIDVSGAASVCFNWNTCTACGEMTGGGGNTSGGSPVSITFTVDMSKETVVPEGVFLAGSFNGWTDMALTDLENGLWSGFTTAMPGDTIQYKFKNGPDGWEGGIEGTCSAGDSDNRLYIVTDQTVSLPLVCFNACTDCSGVAGEGTAGGGGEGGGETGGEGGEGGEMKDSVMVNVTATVDASKLGEDLDPEGMFIAGIFNGWTNMAMTDNGDGTWTAVIPAYSGDDFQFKFKNGPNGWEDNDETGACRIPGTLGNRGMILPEMDVTMPTVCFNSCSACTVPITLVVDLSGVEVAPEGALIAGAFNGWTDEAMTDNGDGTWSSTQTLCPGDNIEYKFKNGPDGWESVSGDCAVAGGDNRLLVVPGAATTLSTVCLNSCIGCNDVNVTFQVDMAGETVSEDGVRYAGSTNGWTDQLMMDNGDGTWSITVPVAKNEAIEYKFKNGPDGWEETVSGDCVVGDSEFGNRGLAVGEEDITAGLVCFNSCAACTEPMVTFTVDMSEQVVDTAGVFISGTFNGWDGTPMTDNGDGTYSITVQVPSRQPIEYKFKNGTEVFEEIAEGSCLAEGFSGNRGYTPGTQDATIPTACFGSCVGCGLIGVTLTVDMSQENVNPAGVFVAGSFNGWMDTQLQDVGNGLWTVTIEAMPGDTVQYKFKNGPDGWEETIEGDCIDAAFGGNRVVFVGETAASVMQTCFESCVECMEAPRPDPKGLTSLPIETSCLNDDGTITIRFDYNYNCGTAAGDLSGLAEIGFHSGVNTWSTVIAWDDSTALTAVNDGNDVFSVTFDPVAYYGLSSFEEIENIGMVFNQGATNPDEPWASEGKDEGEATLGGTCADIFLYFNELQSCSATGGGDVQTSPALLTGGNISCVNSADGTVTLNFDLSLNCAESPGSLAGMQEIGFHSGANMWASVVEWNAETAVTATNNGSDVFSVTVNPESYYGIPLADLENIFFVFNQGPEAPDDAWASEGKQQGDGACEDLRIYISELGACAAPEMEVQKLPLTFESTIIEYQLFGFGAGDGGAIPVEIIANPDPSGVNTSGSVLSITKPADAQTWAGVAMPLAENIDFSAGTILKMNVWSPAAGVPFLLKIEDTNSAPDANGNPSVIAEVFVNTTVANAWETLCFDMSTFPAFSASNAYNQVVVFANMNNPGTGATYYVDGIGYPSTTSIIDLVQENAFKVMPNPFQQSTQITWDNPNNQVFQVKLLTITGQVLRTFSNVSGNNLTLDGTGLQPGMYFLNFQDEAKGVGTLKLLVE